MTKISYFGDLGTFKVIVVNIPEKLVTLQRIVMISSKSVPICSRFYARRANIGKNNDF